MRVKVAYCGLRKDGKYNMVSFNTELKTYTNWDIGHPSDTVLVEAKLSRDVDILREHLEVNGYQNVTGRRWIK